MVVKKTQGQKMYNDENMRILYGVLEPGASIGIHEHTDNSEEVFCVSGQATVYIDGKTEILKAGQAHIVQRDTKHGMKNEGTEDLIIFGVVAKSNKNNFKIEYM